MEMDKIIIINSGSMSKKYALYEGDKKIATFHYENTETGYVLHERLGDAVARTTKISEKEYKHAFDHAVNLIVAQKKVSTEKDIKAAVFRVVAPGTYFTFDRVIDKEFVKNLEKAHEQTPLHIDKMKAEFDQVHARLPDVRIVAISDSRFHKSLPEYARIYAIPKQVREELDIYRFGYHGISVASVAHKIKEKTGLIPEKVIVCHLGGGSSVTALKNGQSLDTTMGYSPLEGLTMSTRVGDIDAGALLAITDMEHFNVQQVRDFVYYNCGIKGISNNSDDVRVLLAAADKGDHDSALALDNYAYHIQKYIGAYHVLLEGLDLLVFTGTIGERSNPMRTRICKGLSALGIEIDEKLNMQDVDGSLYINKPRTNVPVQIIETDEMGEMARRALEML